MVAGFFENHMDDKTRYHAQLLKRMTLSVEGMRPALLSDKAWVLLDRLRAFRHVFRHAYAYELDVRKVRLVLEDAMALKEIYFKDGQAFLHCLKGE